MKNLIFDLDGTLWNTEKSYYYAFNEFLKNNPSKANQMDLNVVEKLKAITMDKMAPLLFPLDSDEERYQNMLECLKYSCEYLIKHETVDQKKIDDIIKLSKDYNLYIVSNCPFAYIDIFFEKSKLRPCFKDIIALGGFTVNNDFDKACNLTNLVSKENLKKEDTFFIGDSPLDLDASTLAKVNFIYLNEEMDILSTVLQKLENQRILALCDEYKEYLYKDASVVLMVNKNQQEYQNLFSFLNLSKNIDTNKTLFKMMEKDAIAKGMKNIVGPINYSTWFDYRLPIDNFDTTFIPDIKGTKEEVSFLYESGYNNLYTYASTLATINKRLELVSKRNKLPSQYYDELIVGPSVFSYTKEIFELSSKCFKEGYLYSDVPYEVFNDIYMKWLRKLPFDIDLYMIREKETSKLVAYGICYYDTINQMYVCKTAAIDKEHQKTNVVMQLAKIVFERARHHQTNKILYHFQNEQKNTLSAFWRGCTILKKRYALFIKELTHENM
mgnify:CR=1 FL=1